MENKKEDCEYIASIEENLIEFLDSDYYEYGDNINDIQNNDL